MNFRDMQFDGDEDILLDLEGHLTETELSKYIQRCKIRANKIYKVTDEHGIPREQVSELVLGDMLGEQEIQKLMEPIGRARQEAVKSMGLGGGIAGVEFAAADKEENEKKLKEAMEKSKREAVEKLGLSEEDQIKFWKMWKDLEVEETEVFRVAFGGDPPAKMEPLKVRLKEGAVPMKQRPLRLTPAAKKALRETVEELTKMGLIRENRQARYVSNMLIIPKPKKNPLDPTEEQRYRCVLDLRYINTLTLPVVFPTTDLERALGKCQGKKFFFSFDLLKGFWQCGIHEDSQEYFSFMTDDNVYSYTRLPMGHIDSAIWFGSQVANIFKDMIDEGLIVVYMDDVMGMTSTYDEYLKLWTRVVKRCAEYGLKINATKCVVGAHDIQFCGRDVDGVGWRFNPRTAKAAEQMPMPTLAGELSSFLCISNWMRTSMVDFTKRSAPLHDFLEKIKRSCGGRRKKDFANEKLAEYGWNEELTMVFEECRQLFVDRLKNAHWNPKGINCIFTDASGGFWGAIYTQVLNWDDSKEIWEQDHIPIAVASGAFTGSQSNWSTIEREAFPIVHCLQQWEHYLQGGTGVKIYTDHKNIADMFQPEKIMPTLGKSQVEKMYRWLYVLSFFKISEIRYIQGKYNVIADMLSRWGHPDYKRSEDTDVKYQFRSVKVAKSFSQFDDGFELPSMKEIEAAQQLKFSWTEADRKYVDEAIKNGDLVLDGEVLKHKGLTWVPDVNDLRLRCMVVAHTSSGGHRSWGIMSKLLKGHLYWKKMSDSIRDFVNKCLNCIKCKAGDTVPRPWGCRAFPEKRNQIVSLDYMFVQKVKSGCHHDLRYILVLRDEYSGYCELVTFAEANSENAISALCSWFARYGIPEVVRSDGGSHFVSTVVKEVCERLGIRREVTAAYCSFSLGSVERINRDVLQLMNLLLREHKMSNEYWPQVVPAIMSIINSTSTVRLGGNCARTVFIGFPRTDPLDVLYDKDLGVLELPLGVTEIKQAARTLVDSFVESRDSMKKYYEKARDRRNQMYIQYYLTGSRKKRFQEDSRKRTNWIQEEMNKLPVEMSVHDRYDIVEQRLLTGMFDVGDFVLVAFASKRDKGKLVITWRGPYRVSNVVNDRVYEVQHLVDDTKRFAHAIRLRFYADKFYQVTEEVLEEIRSESSYDGFFDVESLLECRFNDEIVEWEFRVRWKGFDEVDDSWEPLNQLLTTIPDVVDGFVASIVDENIKTRLQEIIRNTRSLWNQGSSEVANRRKRRRV